MAWLRALIGFALALLLLVFAVLNTQETALVWSPFHPPIEMPMAFAGLVLMAASFIAGAVLVWLNGLKTRLKAGRQERELKHLRRELEVAQNELAAAQKDPSSVSEETRPKGLLQALPRYGR